MEHKGEMNSRGRSVVADLLKGFAVLFMVQVHLTEQFSTPAFYESVWGRISLFLGGTPAAPVFMMVMGFFLQQTRRNLGQGLIRGCLLLGGGLLLNAGLNFHALTAIATDRIDINPLQLLLGVDILFLAGLSVIIISVMKYFFPRNPFPYIILLLCALFLPLLLNHDTENYIAAFFYGNSRWSYFPLLPWLAYPLAGYIFALISRNAQHPRPGKKTRFAALIIFALILASGAYIAVPAVYNLNEYYHHGAFLFVWNISFIFFWALLLRAVAGRLSDTLPGKFIRWTGRNVTAFYVFQWLIIGNTATAIYRSQPAWSLPLWFLLVVALASLFTLAYLRYRAWKRKGVVL